MGFYHSKQPVGTSRKIALWFKIKRLRLDAFQSSFCSSRQDQTGNVLTPPTVLQLRPQHAPQIFVYFSLKKKLPLQYAVVDSLNSQICLLLPSLSIFIPPLFQYKLCRLMYIKRKAFEMACSTLMLFEGHSGLSLPGAHPVCDKTDVSNFRVSDETVVKH